MRRHLPAAGRGVVLCAYCLQKHVERRDAQQQTKCAVAVVREDPVHAGAKKQPHRGRNGLMAGAANLEKDFVLAFELNLPVVQPARKIHRAVEPDERVSVESVVILAVKLDRLDARLYGHSVDLAGLESQSPSAVRLYRIFRRGSKPLLLAAQYRRVYWGVLSPCGLGKAQKLNRAPRNARTRVHGQAPPRG